jgi:hypothetical protein
MDLNSSVASLLAGGLPPLDAPFWSPDPDEIENEFNIPQGLDVLADIRLPKKRRYCGEDTSRHLWDNRNVMTTEPPTPVLVEQQELADADVLFPYALNGANRRANVFSRPPRPHLPPDALSSHMKPKFSSKDSDASPGSVTRVRWLESDDKQLIQLVSELGHNWPLIAARMEGRTSKQVKERWTNQLDPSISTEPWTAEDDLHLVELIRELGHSWCEIARRMKGRTESMVKNRFHANLRKRFGNNVFDPSVPLPELSFKPKSLKSKKTVISQEVRLAAAAAAERAASIASKPRGIHRALPPLTGYE